MNHSLLLGALWWQHTYNREGNRQKSRKFKTTYADVANHSQECYNLCSTKLDIKKHAQCVSTGWRTKCHITDCTHNTFLLLKKHLTCGTELILRGWKIVPNEIL